MNDRCSHSWWESLCYHFRSQQRLLSITPRQQKNSSFALNFLKLLPISQPSKPFKPMSLISWYHTLNHTNNVSICLIRCVFGRLTVGLSTSHWSFVAGCKSFIHGSGSIISLPTVLASSNHVMLEFNGSLNLPSDRVLLRIL